MTINTRENDYFAKGLLEKLDSEDPIFAAYEAQDLSAQVGFDFDSFADVVPRAMDEIRETVEAHGEIEAEGLEHFGDEVADIMFSLVNLARHAKVQELPTMDDLRTTYTERTEASEDPTESIPKQVEKIGEMILSAAEKFEEDGKNSVILELLVEGSIGAMSIADQYELDPTSLLVENVRKYLDRCSVIEDLAKDDGKNWADLAENGEIISYWKRAKDFLR